ncbi:MAG: DUF4197 domain-containing protein [gamma proteobacterium symbiont of Bathyaustriella thionipta]|nr:DUF4197 domain-containing protein [gamma proteobacterium symbiont of Bathyaustriella thionipta]
MLASASHAFDFNKALQQGTDALGGQSTSKNTTSSLDNTEVANGLKEALAQGVENAIKTLGQTDGFLSNDLVRIGLPGSVKSAASLARQMGASSYVDDFEASMNHAAEKAVPEAAHIFGDSIRNMSIQDANSILTGGDTAATDYLRKTAGESLTRSFRPIVEQSTSAAGVTAAYKSMIAQAGPLASMAGSSTLDLDAYVTEEAVNGLFTMIAEEEQNIRANPLARSTDLMKKVFGSE